MEQELIAAYARKDYETIRTQFITLMNARAKMDRWFDKYLDMFDAKFDTMEKDDPAKKIYFAKYNEYTKLNQTIKIAEHYIKQAKIK